MRDWPFPFNYRLFGISLVFIFIIEFLSYVGYLAQPLNQLLFIIITLVTAVLSLKNIAYGIWIILVELVIGSKGYLFSWQIGELSISIRLSLFLVVCLIWLIHLFRQRNWKKLKTIYLVPYIVLLASIFYGGILGLINQHPLKDVFLDANGYLFFGLFFVILYVVQTHKDLWNIFSVMSAGVIASILKTFFLLFVFSHQLFPFVSTLYRWIRVTGVGEITQLSNGFYRIFFQSHLFDVFAYFFVFIALVLMWHTWKMKSWWMLYIRWIFAGGVILISLSRSLWLGACFGVVILMWWLWRDLHWSWKKILLSLVFLGCSTAIQIGVLSLVVNIPLPNTSTVSIGSLVQERTQDITQETAGASRFALIRPLFEAIAIHPIWGQGFGTRVSYASQDPRAIEASNGGLYTTFAFEWGYLDIWLKVGLIGLGVYLYFLWIIFKQAREAWRAQSRNTVTDTVLLGTGISTLVLLAVHATTPYLNHPLGISWLILAAAIFHLYNRKSELV